MVVQLEPDIENSSIELSIILPGVNPLKIESKLVEPLEKSLSKLNGVLKTQSYCVEGYAQLRLEVEKNLKKNTSWLKKLDATLQAWKFNHKKNADYLLGPILNLDPGQHYDALILVKEDQKDLLSQLENLDAIQKVDVFGQTQKQVVIEYDDNEMEAAGIHPIQLKELILKNHKIFPGGKFEHKGNDYTIETDANLDSLNDLMFMSVQDPRNGEVTALKNVVDIEIQDSHHQIESVWSEQKKALVYGIMRQKHVSLKSFSSKIEEFIKTNTSAKIIYSNFTPLQQQEYAAFKGIIVTFITVCFVVALIMGIKTGLLIALIIPAIILSSALFLSWTNLSINLITMATLTLVICLIIDNHIVISEAIQSEKTLSISNIIKKYSGILFTSTLTTIFSFLPLYLSDHVLSDYLREMVIMISISLMISLTFSLLYTPYLTKRLTPKTSSSWFESVTSIYKKFLYKFSKFSFVSCIFCSLLLILGYLSYTHLGDSFFPTQLRSEFKLMMVAPKQIKPETAKAINKAAKDCFISEQPVIFYGMGIPPMSKSQIQDRHSPKLTTFLFSSPPLQNEIDSFKAKFPDHFIQEVTEKLGPGLTYPVTIKLSGYHEQVFQSQGHVLEAVESRSDLNVLPLDSRVQKNYIIEPNKSSTKVGLTPADIALALRLNLKSGIPIDTINIDGESLPIIMRSKSKQKTDMSKIESAYVFPAKGDALQIYEVADIKTHLTPVELTKENGKRTSYIHAFTSQNNYTDIERDLAETLSEKFPEIDIQLMGKSYYGREAKTALFKTIPLVSFFILSLLLWRTRSIFKTFVILSVLPFALSGAFLGLAILSFPLGFMTWVGMIALFGLVINNALLWIEEVDFNSPTANAFQDAAIRRFRPIFMTSSSLILGLCPLYFYGGVIWQHLAIPLIAGLVCSSIAICILLPPVASLCYKIKTCSCLTLKN